MSQKEIKIVNQPSVKPPRPHAVKVYGEKGLEMAKEAASVELNKTAGQPKMIPAEPLTTFSIGQVWTSKKDKSQLIVVGSSATAVLLASREALTSGYAAEVWAMTHSALKAEYDED